MGRANALKLVRVEALNHALRGLPEGSRWCLLDRGRQRPSRARVESLARRQVPDGKILVPSVVSHATNVVEHPEVVADRILNFARVVGRENVIAGTDCGLGGRIHPQLVWAKLAALVEGAKLATKELYGS